LAYDPSQRELQRVLVYDLGGGTFDVSVVQSQEGVVEVLASHGDTQLGGDDFDDLLLTLICDRFADEHGIDLRANLASKARVLRAAEAAKRQLSDHPFARVEEEFIAEKGGVALHLTQEVSRDEYERLIMPLIERTMDCVQRALEDSHLTGRAIDKVVLVGGSTRTPLVGRLLEERLGQLAHREVNPDLIVAMGAALQGAIIAGEDVGSVLVDVTPHSLGIKCLDEMADGFGVPFLHRFAPIIERNTPLPASRSEVFRTVEDRQATVEIDVYQGEDEDVRNNHRVGRFLVEGLASVAAGNQIVVQLDLNLDGILKVSAREKATGLQKQITIENALARFEREEQDQARDRLDELWGRSFGYEVDLAAEDASALAAAAGPSALDVPALVAGPREGQRETVQARALLEKAERLMEKVQPEDRPEVERLMEKVRVALTDRRWSAVTAACDELADVLFYLEDA
jgi:molecular chaperone DnaK